MNKHLKNYLQYKYHKMDLVGLEQQSDYVKYSLEKLSNKKEYLDKKGDALAEKLDGVFFADDVQLDDRQRRVATARTVLSTIVPLTVAGSVLGATVVANSLGIPEEIENESRVILGLYGAGFGAMISAGGMATKSEDIKTLASAIANHVREKSCENKIERLEEKNKLIDNEMFSRFRNDKDSFYDIEEELDEEFENSDDSNLMDYVDITGEFDNSSEKDM